MCSNITGTPAWKEAFDGNEFLEKVKPTTKPNATVEKGLPESIDPDTLGTFKLDPKRSLLSRIVNLKIKEAAASVQSASVPNMLFDELHAYL